MEITLTPELEKLINEQMKSGDYVSPTDVLCEGLLYLKAMRTPKDVRRENLRLEVMKGVEAMQTGNYRSYNSAEEMMEEIIKEARAEFKAKRKNGK
jgi:antitoxin ParD1/3/4